MKYSIIMVVIHEIQQIVFAFYLPSVSSQLQSPLAVPSSHSPCCSPVVFKCPGVYMSHVILTLELAMASSCSLFLTASSSN